MKRSLKKRPGTVNSEELLIVLRFIEVILWSEESSWLGLLQWPSQTAEGADKNRITDETLLLKSVINSVYSTVGVYGAIWSGNEARNID